MENLPFCELVNCLMWLSSSTRPGISNSVRAVAIYCIAPKATHWKAALGILEYIKGTHIYTPSSILASAPNWGENWPFRELVDSLMWRSSSTRPDISNSVRAVARNCIAPKATHWKAALGILEYIKGTHTHTHTHTHHRQPLHRLQSGECSTPCRKKPCRRSRAEEKQVSGLVPHYLLPPSSRNIDLW